MSRLIRTKFDRPDAHYGRYYFGGGGGGGAQVKYDNLEALYKEQASSARLLREQAEKNLPGAVASYVGNVKAVQDPNYANRQAGMAGVDVAGANAMERAATARNLASMGVNPNDPRFAGSMRAQSVGNAANLAAAKNAARNDASKYQLAVSQDAVGTFTGQSNSAATQMGSASSGMANIAAQQNAARQQASNNTANAVGSAVGGTMAVGSLMNWWKDGGKVSKAGFRGGIKRLEQHMLGGQAGGQQQKMQQGFFNIETPQAPSSFSAPQQPQESPVQQAVGTARNIKRVGEPVVRGMQAKSAGAGMAPDQARAAADAYEAAAQSAKSPMEAGKYRQVADSIRGGAGVSSAAPEGFAAANTAAAEASGAAAMGGAAGAAEAATAGAAAAEGAALGSGLAGGTAAAAGDAALAGSITSGAGALGTGAAAGGASSLAAGAGAGAAAAGGGAMAAVGAALPWVGAAFAVGSLLDLWADGGEVGGQDNLAHDLREAGGKVPGEWRENRDTVPALLVEEEHVLNTEAAKLVGHDELERLNAEGLKMREKGVTPDQIKPKFGIRRKGAGA
jgi:hypothetical protein